MANKQVIMITEPEQDVPEAFIDHMLRECGQCFGASVADPSKPNDKDKLKTLVSDKPIPKGDIMSFLAKRKKDRLFIWWSTALTNKSDVQPFPVVLTKTTNVPCVVALMDGDFPALKEGGRSGAYTTMEEYLFPKLSGIYQAEGGDLGKFLNHISNDKLLAREINGLAESRSVITLMASTGWFQTFQNRNEFGKMFPWGWVSNPMGYDESTYPKKKEDPADDDGLDFLDAAGDTGAPAAKDKTPDPAVSETAVKSTSVPSVANGGDTAIPVSAMGTPPKDNDLTGERWVKPPSPNEPDGVRGKPEIEGWYKRLCGFAPRGYKDRPAIKVTNKRWFSFLEEEKERRDKDAAYKKSSNTASNKDTDPKHVVPSAPTDKDYQPIIPAGEKKAFADSFRQRGTVKKYLDRSSRDSMDPRSIGKLEDGDHPPFHVALDLDGLETVFWWTPDDISELVNKYPEAAKVLIKDLARACNSAYEDLDKVTDPVDSTVPGALAQIS